jgi:hypothetical protein
MTKGLTGTLLSQASMPEFSAEANNVVRASAVIVK